LAAVCLLGFACLIGGARLVALRTGLMTPGLRSYRIESGTMEPTCKAGQTVFAVQGYYLLHPPQFGDIVVLKKPDLTRRVLIKRIVGLPGDRIKVSDGKLWRNGQAVSEPYIKEPMAYTWPDRGEITVPSDAVVVLGDNRNDSPDSHTWSPPCIPVRDIVAMVASPQVQRR